MDFSELKEELYARGTDYLEEDADGIARAERWLNQAYREILNLHAWPFLQATATGTADAGVVEVGDLRKIRFVLDTSVTPSMRLNRISLDDLAEEDLDLDQTGIPEWYYVDGATTVKSYPLGGTIKVYYIKRVEPMSAPGDEPIFDEEYHNLIVDRAMIRAYIDNDNFEAAVALRQEFDSTIAAMAEDYMLNSREPQYILVDPYDG